MARRKKVCRGRGCGEVAAFNPIPEAALAGTPAEHATEFQHARHEVLEHIQSAAEAMRSAQCLPAGTHIDRGYEAIGRMQANAYEEAEIIEAARLRAALQRADEPFERKCVRATPISDGMSRMVHAQRPGLASGVPGLIAAASIPLGVPGVPFMGLAAPRAENWDEYLELSAQKAAAGRDEDVSEIEDELEALQVVEALSPVGFRPQSREELEAFRRDIDAKRAVQKAAIDSLKAKAKAGSNAARKRIASSKNAELIDRELEKLRIEEGFETPMYVSSKRFVRRKGGVLQGVGLSGPFRR